MHVALSGSRARQLFGHRKAQPKGDGTPVSIPSSSLSSGVSSSETAASASLLPIVAKTAGSVQTTLCSAASPTVRDKRPSLCAPPCSPFRRRARR